VSIAGRLNAFHDILELMPEDVNSKWKIVNRIRKSIYHSQFTIRKKGFTLIEFLVVLGLLVMTVGSTLLFLTSILKGSNKANVTAEAKQNGQIVLDSLEKKIRNAVSASPIGVNSPQITLVQDTNKKLYIKCLSGTESTNGLIGLVEQENPPGDDSPYRNNPMTNTDLIAGVDIANCSFDVLGPSEGGTSSFIVTIRFTVNQGVSAPSRKDFVANVQVQTSIALRQYNQ